jgi:hypothetical protein
MEVVMGQFRAIIFGLFVAFPATCQADCNPLDFHDKNVAFTDFQAQLQYAEDVTNNKSGASSASGGLDFFDIFDLEGKSQSNYVQNLKRIRNLDLKESDRQFLYTSEMTDNELQGYLGCLAGQNILVIPPHASASSPTFSVTVRLRQGLREGNVPVTVDVLGAKITGVSPGNWRLVKNNTQAIAQTATGTDIQVRVSRTPGERFEITVSVPGSPSAGLTLPAPPTTYLIEEIRYSTVFPSACDKGCLVPNPTQGALSIHLPNTEVIKPRSENIETFSAGNSIPGFSPHDGPLYGNNINRDTYSQMDYKAHDLQVSVTVSGAQHPFVWCGRWLLWTKVFVAVPIGAKSPVQAKPDMSCTPRY